MARLAPVYGYEFHEPNPAQGPLLGPPEPGLDYGDYHTSDLPYVFGVTAPDGSRVTGKDLALSRRVIDYWSNLAIAGDPDFPRVRFPFWIDYRFSSLLLSLQNQITYLPERGFSDEHFCNFWSPYLPENNM